MAELPPFWPTSQTDFPHTNSLVLASPCPPHPHPMPPSQPPPLGPYGQQTAMRTGLILVLTNKGFHTAACTELRTQPQQHAPCSAALHLVRCQVLRSDAPAPNPAGWKPVAGQLYGRYLPRSRPGHAKSNPRPKQGQGNSFMYSPDVRAVPSHFFHEA